VHRKHTAAAAAAYISATTVGGASGRLVAGPLAGLIGWRGALLVVAALCAVASVVFLRLMPRARGYRPEGRGPVRTVSDGIRSSLTDPRLLALYAQPVLLMGGFVGVYNYLAFRLEDPPFGLPATVGSLIFAAYAAGTVSSRLTGRWVPRFGRRRVLLGGTLAMVAGSALTLSRRLALVVTGLLVLTSGLFAAHATASAWVGERATNGRAQATALYNVSLYTGSGLVGWLLGYAWSGFGWGALVVGVVALCTAAVAVTLVALPGSRRDRFVTT
jgi:predicted MFS family arabinose efflux permease